MNICLAPMPIVWGDKRANLDTLAAVCERMHPDTDLLVLPEAFSTGFPSGMDKEEVRPLAERNTGATVDFIKALARRHNVAIAGSYIADSGGLLCNRAFFIEPNGEETFADKKHLFTMAGEHNIFSAGHSRLSVRFRGWNIAMVVCYDIRFPVWCRNCNNEYDLLIAVANWPKVRVDAWNKLLPARAIENEAYVIGVDCLGSDPAGFEYDGSSAVIDFKGKDITVRQSVPQEGATQPTTEAKCAAQGAAGQPATAFCPLLYARLDHEALDRFRSKFPAWRDADPFTLTLA